MCNADVNHRILGELTLRLAEGFRGLIGFCGKFSSLLGVGFDFARSEFNSPMLSLRYMEGRRPRSVVRRRRAIVGRAERVSTIFTSRRVI